MLVGLLATGIISKVPYISLKILDLRDDSQSLVQARIQVEEIASETDDMYSYANDGRVTLSFNVSSLNGSLPSDQGVQFTVGSEFSQVNTTTTRGTNVTFTGFSTGVYELSAKDEALNTTFIVTLAIGIGTDSSFIRYKNANYEGVGSIFFVPVLHEIPNNAGANITIDNVRNDFVSISSNQVVYEPYNKPLSGTHLADQKFNIGGLDGKSASLYETNVYDPITRITHNLFLSAGYKPYFGPSLTINYLNSETSNANNGILSITFNSNETLSADEVMFSLDNGTNTVIQTADRETAVIFSDLDSSLVVDNDLVITELSTGRAWYLKIHVGYGSNISYIQYNDNVLYQTGDTIIFNVDQSIIPSRTKLLYEDKVYNKGDTIILN